MQSHWSRESCVICVISRYVRIHKKYDLLLKKTDWLFGLSKLDTGTQTIFFPFLNMYGNLFNVRPRGKMKMCVKN